MKAKRAAGTGGRRPRIDVAQRRARLGRRQHLAPEARATDAVGAARDVVGFHATDPATVFLSARVRVAGLGVGDLEHALYDQRALLRHLGMRRTLFVLPTPFVPVVQAACTDTIAVTQRRRLVADVERGGVARNGARWLAKVEEATMRALDAGPATGSQLSRAVPSLQAKVSYAEGTTWGGPVGVTTRVLTVMAAEGRIVRGPPNGRWTSSQHRWEQAPAAAQTSIGAAEARAELVRCWLRSFGPGTENDLKWWTGLGLGQVRTALAAVGAVEVDLDGGSGESVGYLLPDDLEPLSPTGPWVALLPALDSSTMGWKERDWYLGDHGQALFDRNGNAGPTVWCDGRIVGGWGQRPGGDVVVRLLEDVGKAATALVEAETASLQTWLGDTRVIPRFQTPLQRELAAG